MKINIGNLVNLFSMGSILKKRMDDEEAKEKAKEEVIYKPDYESLNLYEKNCLMVFYQAFDENMETYTFGRKGRMWYVFKTEGDSHEYVDCGTSVYNACGALITTIHDSEREKKFFEELTKPKLKSDLDEFVKSLNEKTRSKQLIYRRKKGIN